MKIEISDNNVKNNNLEDKVMYTLRWEILRFLILYSNNNTKLDDLEKWGTGLPSDEDERMKERIRYFY
jgi:hypothetical protein